MQDFGRVFQSFERSDTFFDNEIRDAIGRGAQTTAGRLRVQQIAHTQAFFVLLWAQFESGLDDKVRNHCARRQRTSAKSTSRAWKLLEKRHKDDRLGVMEKVELLADRGSRTFNDIQTYYRLRNGYAHGQFQQTPIDLRRVANHLALLYRALRVGR